MLARRRRPEDGESVAGKTEAVMMFKIGIEDLSFD